MSVCVTEDQTPPLQTREHLHPSPAQKVGSALPNLTAVCAVELGEGDPDTGLESVCRNPLHSPAEIPSLVQS